MAVSDAIVFTTACTQVPLSHACTQPPATIICAFRTSRPIGPIAPADPGEHPVDRGAQLGGDHREPLRLVGELVRVRVRTDSSDPRLALAGDHDRPRQRLVTVVLVDRVGLTGEHGLVDLQRAPLRDDGVGGHLVAGPEDQDVVEHHIRGRDLELLALAAHARPRGVQQSEAIELRLGAELLGASDDRVRERGEAEQRILPAAEQQKDEEATADDRVEEREHVGADDVPDAATRVRREGVRAPGGDALGDLRLREPHRGVDRRGQCVDVGHGIHGSHPMTTPDMRAPSGCRRMGRYGYSRRRHPPPRTRRRLAGRRRALRTPPLDRALGVAAQRSRRRGAGRTERRRRSRRRLEQRRHPPARRTPARAPHRLDGPPRPLGLVIRSRVVAALHHDRGRARRHTGRRRGLGRRGSRGVPRRGRPRAAVASARTGASAQRPHPLARRGDERAGCRLHRRRGVARVPDPRRSERDPGLHRPAQLRARSAARTAARRHPSPREPSGPHGRRQRVRAARGGARVRVRRGPRLGGAHRVERQSPPLRRAGLHRRAGARRRRGAAARRDHPGERRGVREPVGLRCVRRRTRRDRTPIPPAICARSAPIALRGDR